MQTIQIVLDEKLLKDADRAAKRSKMNRSALFREAMSEYLKRLHTLDLEARDRKGYENIPDSLDDILLWEQEAVWPTR